MASYASRACQVVITVDVAICASTGRYGMQAGQWEAGGGVVEGGVGPRYGIVALLARRGESLVRNRRGRVVEVRLVAADAGRIRNVVVVVDVAIRTRAWRNRVRTSQRESRFRVIERGGLPTASVVANLASLRKSAGYVVRIRGALEVLQVAAHAGRAGQVVVVVDVTIGAGARRHSMETGKRESRAVMVERRVHPGAGAMALFAGLREVRSHMVGIGSALEVFQVTGDASGAGQIVVVVDVTIGAGTGWDGVQSGERKPGAVVVELCVHPVAGVVALLACLREVGSRVVRIRRALEVFEVARYAGVGRQVEVVINVAVSASPRWHRV